MAVAVWMRGAAGRAADTEAAAPAANLAAFLDAREPRYRQALDRARAWIEALEINPVELRRHGIKGKKKVAEWLDAALRLYEASGPSEQAALRARIERLSAMTRTPGYHDMARVPDRQFREDSTSYLRTAYLLDRFGLDIALYRREIRKLQPRLDAHLVERGVDQRMAFHRYYRHFGLAEPFPLDAAFRSGVRPAIPRPASGGRRPALRPEQRHTRRPAPGGSKRECAGGCGLGNPSMSPDRLLLDFVRLCRRWRGHGRGRVGGL